MKTLIVLICLVSFNVFGKECLNAAGNISLAHKLQMRLTHLAEKNHPDPCSLDEKEWEETRNGRLKMIKHIQGELKFKKKTSAAFFTDLDVNSNAIDITEEEICALVKKSKNEWVDRSCSTNSLKLKLGTLNLLNMSFKEACNSVWDDIKESKKKCYEDAVTEAKRDPPGEEISPAEEDSPKEVITEKTPSNFYGPRTYIRNRNSVIPTSSGASSQ
jgi:hypothetical protein